MADTGPEHHQGLREWEDRFPLALLAALDAHVPDAEPDPEPKTWEEIYDESPPDDDDVAFWVDNACCQGIFTMEQRGQIFAVL